MEPKRGYRMRKQIEWRGITWNHPRGYESIAAVSQEFERRYPEVKITWDIRSLKDFGDYPVTLLAQNYDFIMLDHPHIGSASNAGALIPLEQYLPKEFLQDQEKNSVGKSYESYQLDGHQWALAVDAAAQVAAYRPDLFSDFGIAVPKYWNEVFELAQKNSKNHFVGLPLCPTDVYCCFLSICANQSGTSFFTEENGIDWKTAHSAIKRLCRLAQIVHPDSLDMNPIQMLDKMAETDEIFYVPLLFGYSNYARQPKNGRKRVYFTDIPSVTDIPNGALLGGVGLSISSRCREVKMASEFVMYAAGEEMQKGIYFEHEGQPGYLGAWNDEKVNNASGDFFKNTLNTLQHSYLRPRYNGYNEFQEKAGFVLNLGLKQKDRPDVILEQLKAVFEEVNRRK